MYFNFRKDESYCDVMRVSCYTKVRLRNLCKKIKNYITNCLKSTPCFSVYMEITIGVDMLIANTILFKGFNFDIGSGCLIGLLVCRWRNS